jgi:Flp pilus assembly protein TadB
VDWLVLVGLGIMWAVFLIPAPRGRRGETGVEDFERRMELLARAEAHGTAGRWIVTPRKGMRFIGPAERKRARARERRRRVFAFLLQSITITFLIGVVLPPLRPVWIASGFFAGLLLVYSWLLLSMKAREARAPGMHASETPRRPAATRARYVAEGVGARARPTYNGLGSLGEGDHVHVVVRPAGARA